MVAEKQWDYAANVSIPEWIVVVPGVIPQIRGYRSEDRGEAEPESLLGDKV